MRIALLCDDGLLLDGLKGLLATVPGWENVAAERSWDRLESQSRRAPFDALIVASTVNSREAAKAARAKKRMGFELISDAPDVPADARFDRSKGFESLKSALISLGVGRTLKASAVRESLSPYGSRGDLTPREREVARLVSQGMPNRRIATVLGIQEQSVKNLVSVVMRKLRCENRVQLALHLSAARH